MFVLSNGAPLKIFWNDGINVVMFHDSDKLIEKVTTILEQKQLLTEGHYFFICNYSQYIMRHLSWLGPFWDGFKQSNPEHYLYAVKHTLFLMNSPEEETIFRRRFPDFRVATVSNCFTLDENLFSLEPVAKQYRALLNAKPYQFKRHFLAEWVADLAVVTYGQDKALLANDGVDLRNFPCKKLFMGISEAEVRSVIYASRCGLVLSASEGACYASVEYLLGGIPVVSTASVGGRDQYYTAENAIITGDTAMDVSAAVREWCLRWDRNEVNPVSIRQDAIAKQIFYRQKLAAELSQMTNMPASLWNNYINQIVHQSNKLQNRCNYWVGDHGVSVAP